MCGARRDRHEPAIPIDNRPVTIGFWGWVAILGVTGWTFLILLKVVEFL